MSPTPAMPTDRRSATRRRPGITSLLLLAAAVGGLAAMGAVPAAGLLDDREAAGTTAQLVSRSAAAHTLIVEVESIAHGPVPTPEGFTVAEDEPLVYVGADGERIDPERIRAWLADRDSPMAPYAEELVAAGLDHDVDPRLVVGIAAIESSAGKRLPPGSHNAWGWNGDGPHGLKAWPSWPVAIDRFTEGLARVYDTDNVDERMARKYVPPNWQKWLRTVRWVIDDI